ncbi:unnamed protein product [Calypogeia fissa]
MRDDQEDDGGAGPSGSEKQNDTKVSKVIDVALKSGEGQSGECESRDDHSEGDLRVASLAYLDVVNSHSRLEIKKYMFSVSSPSQVLERPNTICPEL